MSDQSFELHARLPKILTIAVLSLVLGILTDYFFYGQDLGLSFPVFIWLVTAVIFGLSFSWKTKISKSTYWLVPPLLFFSGMVAVRSSEIVTTLNVWTTYLLMISFVYSLTGGKIIDYVVSKYITKTLSASLDIIHHAANFLTDFFQLRTLIKGHKTLSQVIKGIVMAIPVLLIFLVLFASADIVFNKYLTDMFKVHISGETFFRVIIVMIASSLLSGLFYYATHHKEVPELKETTATEKKTNGIVEISIFLGLINALFLTFITIQFTYFFGGQNNISVEGFSYAEYAHRGFFELVAVAILSFIIVIISQKSVEKKDNKHLLVFKILSTMLTLEVVVIMVSAFQRLMIYENTFGFTELRLYVQLFIIWLGIIFFLLLYKIVADKKENIYAFTAFVGSLLFLVFLNGFNPDAFIAQKNIENLQTTGKLDVTYLSSLSDDAVPELVKALDSKNQILCTDEYEVSMQPCTTLMAIKLYKKTIDGMNQNWQSWNLSRANAQAALASKSNQIEALGKNAMTNENAGQRIDYENDFVQ